MYALRRCSVCKGRRLISRAVGASHNISFSSILSIDSASDLHANRLHGDGDDPRSHELASGMQKSSSEPYSEHRPCCLVSLVRLAKGLEEASLKQPYTHSSLRYGGQSYRKLITAYPSHGKRGPLFLAVGPYWDYPIGWQGPKIRGMPSVFGPKAPADGIAESYSPSSMSNVMLGSESVESFVAVRRRKGQHRRGNYLCESAISLKRSQP